jgi:hypothetical protein
MGDARPRISDAAPKIGSQGRPIIVAIVLLGCIAVLALGALYEAAIALGILDIGPQPGDDPAGYAPIIASVMVALVVAGVLLFVGGAVTPLGADWPTILVQLLDIAAVGFVIVRWYSYDAYYAPSLRRMSDGGLIPGIWIVGLAAIAAAAVLTAPRNSRAGLLLSGAATWISAFTALLAAGGH